MSPGNSRLLRIATYSSVATASVLILAKLAAWLMTQSVTVLASLVDSLMDAGASLINLLAVRYSLRPADAEHRFGHGKAEALAGLGQATFIMGSAAFLLLQAMDRLVHPQPLAKVGVGLAVMGFAILATIGLLCVQHYVIRRTQSTAIRADALHYATDLATNTATVIALLLAQLGWHGLDPLFAIAIALYILYSAYRIGDDAIQLLMDRELPAEQRNLIERLAQATPGVLGVHGVRTRQSGQTKVMQLHLALGDHLPLAEAHRVSLEVESRLRAAFPIADILIHQDPVSIGDEQAPEDERPPQAPARDLHSFTN
jgi:ferrous-iron efflux pump FieF